MNESTVSPVWLTLAIVGGFLVIFPSFWCLIVWLLSQFGGWSRLARTYAAGGRAPSGRRFVGITGMVGGVSYRNILTVHLNDEGFFVEPMVLFRIAHPRLFIPWREVTARTPFTVLWWRSERLTIGHPKIGSITLPVDVLASGNE